MRRSVILYILRERTGLAAVRPEDRSVHADKCWRKG